MKILKLFEEKQKDVHRARTPVIAFFGDSVTQGCFDLHTIPEEPGYATVFKSSDAYHARLREMLSMLYPKVPAHFINAGISGNNAYVALDRLERDVLSFKPDLTVVCFGLNDSSADVYTPEGYKENLIKIFTALKDAGSEVIFMTPNMMNTDINAGIKDEIIEKIAQNAMKVQNSGRMDEFMAAAREAVLECDVKLCDVYTIWQKINKNGVQVSALLSNYINHPTKEMHYMFAYELLKTMLED